MHRTYIRMPKVFHKHIKYAKNPAASLAQKHWEIITHVKQNKHTILHTYRYTYVCVRGCLCKAALSQRQNRVI